ncbi:MAG: hypothetical protein HUJ25_05735 [Crocinitomicaceae bacterium]|nr:hypothetical protein [Crocinitomicaceae bacterium]
MRSILLTLLILISTVAKSNDTLNVKSNQGLVFAQFGGVQSIFHVGYGHEFRKDKKFTIGILGGIGMDFIRFRPHYNIETIVKARLQYNINIKNALILELGTQYIFNPWYESDPDKYFPDCSSQRCPEAYFTQFINVGYRHSFKNGLSLIGQVYLNYYDNRFFYVYPGFEIDYSFGRKRRITQ